MPNRRTNDSNSNSNSATVGFEDKLWAAADKLRGNMDAAEYKHVVLGLIFSSTFPTPSRNTARSWKPSDPKAQTQKIQTSTGP